MSETKVFITGATGFIGELLVRALVEQGKTVHALVRSPEKAKKISHPQVKIFKGDLSDPESIAEAMSGCREVYHLAAFAKLWAKDPDIFHRINVDGTLFVLEAARKTNVGKVVVTSTAGVLGPSDKGLVSEETPRSLDFFNDYERTKAISEEKIREYVKEGMNVVIVNPSRVYGPGELSDSNAVTKLICKYAEGKWRVIPGDGKSIGNYVFVDDVVKGHLLAMESGKAGERYILGGDNASFDNFFGLLREITGKNQRMFNLPLSLMMFVARTQNLKTKLLGTAPLITPMWVKRYLYNWELDISKATRDLGYEKTSLAEGIRKTLDWHRNTL